MNRSTDDEELPDRFPTGMVLRVADDDERIIEGLIAPWDRPTRVQTPIPGWESYRRGAFDASLSDRSLRIPLLLRHNEDNIAGVLIGHDNREDGQHATFRVLRTRAGDDALELIHAQVAVGLSVGGWGVAAATTTRTEPGTRRRIIERAKMRLDHVALVRHPAYREAQVLDPAPRRHLRPVSDPVAVARASIRMRERRHEILMRTYGHLAG